MTLTFETPSTKCPLRKFNGRPVRILGRAGGRKLRRLEMGYAPAFLVEILSSERWPYVLARGVAYGDELWLTPTETQ